MVRFFGVDLHAPRGIDWMLLPLAGGLSGYLGAHIHHFVGSASVAPVAGLAAAGTAAMGLALAGADTDAGWRGVVLTLGGALVAFVLAAGLVAVRSS